MHELRIRPARSDDYDSLVEALWYASTWRPEVKATLEDTISHPELLVYHKDWGRHGDLGVVAEVDEKVIGAAFGRLHTADNHGYGYVSADIPEIGIGIAPPYRKLGLGRKLFLALERSYRALGVNAVSLSVETDNDSRFLYQNLGYRIVETADDAHTMVKDIDVGWISKTYDFPAPAQRVYEHLTNAELLAEWWPQEATTDPTVSGVFALEWPAMDRTLRGTYTAADPGRRLGFTWKWDHEDVPIRQVNISLDEDAGKTRLSLEHSYGSFEEAEGYSDGWRHFFEQLNTLLGD